MSQIQHAEPVPCSREVARLLCPDNFQVTGDKICAYDRTTKILLSYDFHKRKGSNAQPSVLKKVVWAIWLVNSTSDAIAQLISIIFKQ
ncbi:hypothetical protein L596_017170 [Steinernema carpocapsae]|uniref:Uncharacterized protein n=1 Tax=Steinernema carpocapsae TaxID=34508 RepID=A0A4U5N1M1_STECR|nr:hypothetical protein L596_017170 [Steinernema carpocapsae]